MIRSLLPNPPPPCVHRIGSGQARLNGMHSPSPLEVLSTQRIRQGYSILGMEDLSSQESIRLREERDGMAS